jgi:hypothetical protein
MQTSTAIAQITQTAVIYATQTAVMWTPSYTPTFTHTPVSTNTPGTPTTASFYITVTGSGGSMDISFSDGVNGISGVYALPYRSSTYTENLSNCFLLGCGDTTTGLPVTVNLYKNGVLWRTGTSAPPNSVQVNFGDCFSSL